MTGPNDDPCGMPQLRLTILEMIDVGLFAFGLAFGLKATS